MRAFLLLAVLLAACETPPPPPCPGSRVAAFTFPATDGGSGCPFFAGDGGPPQLGGFDAMVAWDRNGTDAAFCKQLAYAGPALGTHAGDHLEVERTAEGVTPSACDPDCTVTLLETVDGTVTRNATQDPVGFSGTLRTTLSGQTPDGGTTCRCGLPCDVTYPLEGGLTQ